MFTGTQANAWLLGRGGWGGEGGVKTQSEMGYLTWPSLRDLVQGLPTERYDLTFDTKLLYITRRL